MARRSWADITEEEFAEEAESKAWSRRRLRVSGAPDIVMRAAATLHADIVAGRVGPDLAVLRAKHLAKESPPAAAWLCAAVSRSAVEPGPSQNESVCNCRISGWKTASEDGIRQLDPTERHNGLQSTRRQRRLDYARGSRVREPSGRASADQQLRQDPSGGAREQCRDHLDGTRRQTRGTKIRPCRKQVEVHSAGEELLQR